MFSLKKEGNVVYTHLSYMSDEVVFLISKIKLINNFKIFSIKKEEMLF